MDSIIAGAGGGCFTGGTLVRIPDGYRRIDSLSVGDTVISFDDSGDFHEAKIIAVHVHENEAVYQYSLWGAGAVEATPNHWVLNQFNAFVAIGSLGSDDCIVDINGHLRPIISSEFIGHKTVYNLTVEGQHTFIANNIRVHNAGLGLGKIAGAGGGGKGGGGGSPDTADDNLNSRAYAKIIDLIGEGEIEGFPSARQYSRSSDEYKKAMLKDIYFDKTSVMREKANINDLVDRDFNFKKVRPKHFDIRWGTQNQDAIPGFSAAENEYSVGIVVAKDAPVTRTITDTDVDKVRVTLTWQAIQELQDDGDIVGSEVKYQILVSYNGGPFDVVKDKKLNGRTGNLFQKSHIVWLSGSFPVQIRVKRLTKNPSDVKIQNEFTWTSYTEIVDAKLRYPNSAIVAMDIDSRNFTSIPTRSYRVRGLKIKIPSNATVNDSDGSLTYNGIWDGTFGAQQWCADPAWCLWDLLTNCRYGLGQHIKTKDLDKWSFYEASKYCNEKVDSGLKDTKGNAILESRFLCNVSIQSQDEAYKVVNDMCSVFRAMPYWGAGTLVIAQDRPASPSYLFNQTNVTEEGFQYNGSSLRSRHTVAVVGYLDTENQETAYESVENAEGIARYGVITAEISAFACTSRTQAHRIGEWLLYTEQYETETVTFKTGIDAGSAVRPGMIIATSDPLRSGARRGGRIRAAGSNYIVIDEPTATDIPLTGSPTVHVSMTDGTVEVKTVTAAAGAKITISGTFTSTPLVGGVFIYNNDDMRRARWRVLNVQESDGVSYQITAISYNSSKYDYVERGYEFDTKVYLPLTVDKPSDPQNITADTVAYESSGQLASKVMLSWDSDPNAVNYEIRYRRIG
jgi:predicted phage tail protein